MADVIHPDWFSNKRKTPEDILRAAFNYPANHGRLSLVIEYAAIEKDIISLQVRLEEIEDELNDMPPLVLVD